MALVDVIIPVYNTPLDYVQRTLRSVLEQTLSDWKAIVVNDGSASEYGEKLEQLIAQINDSRIVYLRTENRGISAARNTAIRASDSPYIAMLDSDDVWYPIRLQVGIDVMQAQPEIDVVHAKTDLIQPDGRLTPARPRLFDPNQLSPQAQFGKLLESNYIAILTALVRRATLTEVGLFDESLLTIEDKEFWLRLMLRGKRFLFLDQVIATYRLHPVSISRNVKKMAQGRLALIEKIDRTIEQTSLISRTEWSRYRPEMVRHMYREMAEEYLGKGSVWHALWYSLPFFCGWSAKSMRLSLRCLRGAVFPGSR